MAFQRSTWWNLVLVFGLMVLIPSCSEPTNQDLSASTGESLYLQNCAVCHGEDGKLQSSGAPDLSVSKLNSEEITQLINKGKNGMPPFNRVIPQDSTMSELVEFVKALRE